jgi:nucleoside-triphosphatase THEP1
VPRITNPIAMTDPPSSGTNQKQQATALTGVWLHAAVLGSLWASNEIIVGSLLHNLRVPLSGTLLSAIGAAILIGGHQLWPQKGLFWRAGLICAVMKSISPSAVIVGPMVGIFMEGVLLETGIRVFGLAFPGLIVGGALAVSWSMIQKVISLVITFGFNIVLLYDRLFDFASRSLGMNRFGSIDLVLALFGINLLFGAVVAVIAVRIGRRARTATPGIALRPEAEGKTSYGLTLDPRQQFSLPLLALNAAALVTGLIMISTSPFWSGSLFVAIYAFLTLQRYRRSLQRLNRPKLWIGLAAIMLLSGLLLDSLRGPGLQWSWDGLLIGATMTLRAVLVVLGFSVLSIELRNPVILDWFARQGMHQLSSALDVAFEALPAFVAAASQERDLLRRPWTALPRLLHHAQDWLLRYTHEPPLSHAIVIVTGQPGSGKTSFVAAVVEAMRANGLAVGGILAPGQWRDHVREGFDIMDLATGERMALCRRDGMMGTVKAGPFTFSNSGLTFGRKALTNAWQIPPDVVTVDEIGLLELRGAGWSEAVDRLVETFARPMLWVIRTDLVHDVIRR